MSNVYAPPATAVDDVHRGGAAGVTAAVVESMRGTKGWVLLIAVCMFLGAALSAFGGIAVMASSVFMPADKAGPAGTAMFIVMGALYLFFAFLYALLGWYLLRFHSAATRLVREAQVIDLETALEAQRKFWRMAGIMVLAMVVLMVLGIGAAIMIPAFMAASGRGG